MQSVRQSCCSDADTNSTGVRVSDFKHELWGHRFRHATVLWVACLKRRHLILAGRGNAILGNSMLALLLFVVQVVTNSCSRFGVPLAAFSDPPLRTVGVHYKRKVASQGMRKQARSKAVLAVDAALDKKKER